jgi:hypothetical protein
MNQDLWQEWLGRTRHDLFHTAHYHRVQAGPARAIAYLAVYGTPDKFVALPYLLKPISARGDSSALKEVCSVYGYSGPLVYNCQNDSDFVIKAWGALSGHWADQRAVSAFVRFHPILDNARWFNSNPTPNPTRPRGSVVFVGNTVTIDLSQTADSIWYGYSRQIRQAVRRCSSCGIVVTEDLEWAHLEDFVDIYYKTMKRNNADEFYFFPTRYLLNLRDAAGYHASLIVAHYKQKVVSAAILFEYGSIVNLHLLATDSEYLHLSPSKAVVHAAQKWAKARGNSTFHLGGGRGGRDDEPLFHFKAAFSRQFTQFYVGRWILDRHAYAFLTEERRKEAANLECKKIDSSYFPAYRAPLIGFTNR